MQPNPQQAPAARTPALCACRVETTSRRTPSSQRLTCSPLASQGTCTCTAAPACSSTPSQRPSLPSGRCLQAGPWAAASLAWTASELECYMESQRAGMIVQHPRNEWLAPGPGAWVCQPARFVPYRACSIRCTQPRCKIGKLLQMARASRGMTRQGWCLRRMSRGSSFCGVRSRAASRVACTVAAGAAAAAAPLRLWLGTTMLVRGASKALCLCLLLRRAGCSDR